MKLLAVFSKSLHDFSNIVWFLVFSWKIAVKFHTYGCFCQRGFFVMADRNQKDDAGKSLTFFNQDFFVQVCYTCLFSLLKGKKFDVEHVNDKL